MTDHVQINKIIRDTRLKDICSEMESELYRLLDFWSTKVIDKENGGFVGRIDHFGHVESEAPKGSVLNARILWTFSAAFRITGIKKYKVAAERAYSYLTERFWDKEEGGLIWSVDYSGKPLSTRKQAYAQGFGIYALSEYYRATKQIESLDYAKQIYNIVEKEFWEDLKPGYIEALKKNWEPMNDMRLSEKDVNLPRSMNTHLHMMESLVNLYRVWPDKKVKIRLFSLIDIFTNKIIDQKTGHFNLFFDKEWKPHSTAVSFGHDIEGSWLLYDAAKTVGEPISVKQIAANCLKLVDLTIKEGFDKNGSVFYEREQDLIDYDKHWWPQAEALVGLFNAWEITQDEKYLLLMKKTWIFIKDHLIDKKNGEWYWRVNKEGIPINTDDKVGFWKCPYHNTRALLEILERVHCPSFYTDDSSSTSKIVNF